jgi:hypothetical protein
MTIHKKMKFFLIQISKFERLWAGTNRLIFPFKTFQNWGSLSSLFLRMILPTRVTRWLSLLLSVAAAQGVNLHAFKFNHPKRLPTISHSLLSKKWLARTIKRIDW